MGTLAKRTIPRAPIRAVPDAVEPPKVADIYSKWKAEIASRDWKACHEAGDRREPIFLCHRVVRGWR